MAVRQSSPSVGKTLAADQGSARFSNNHSRASRGLGTTARGDKDLHAPDLVELDKRYCRRDCFDCALWNLGAVQLGDVVACT